MPGKRRSAKQPAPLHRLGCIFFRTDAGAEPVREWLKEQIPSEARKAIGADIKTVQQTWPVGKPLVDSLGDGLWKRDLDLARRRKAQMERR